MDTMKSKAKGWLRAIRPLLLQGLSIAGLATQSLSPYVKRQEEARLQKVPRYTATTTDLLGKKFHIVDSCTYLVGVREILVERVYDFGGSSPAPTIVDCGANIGLSVLFFKERYPDARIIAFEADRQIFNVLCKNIASFDLRGVELHHSAVWTANTEVLFSPEGGASGRIVMPGDQSTVCVPGTRLKDVLKREPVDFLKMDIEGAETEVLKDCAEELSRIPSLFVEYHSHFGQRQTLQELLQILVGAGFRYHIKEAYTHEKPFTDRPLNAGCDLQLNIFGYRLDGPCKVT